MLSEKAIAAQIDAVWWGHVRAGFLRKVGEILAKEEVYEQYLAMKKKVHVSKRMEAFTSQLGAGQFIGRVVYNAIRTHYGD